MNLKLVFVFLITFFTNVSTQNTRKSDLSQTLRRLKNVLYKLQTKQYVIIDTKKVNKSQNTTKIDVIGGQHNKIFNNTTEDIINLIDMSSSKNCEENQRGDRKIVCPMARNQIFEFSDYLNPVQRLLLNSKLCTHVVFKHYTELKISSNTVTFEIHPDFNERRKDIKDLQSKGISVLIGSMNYDTEGFCKVLTTIFSNSNQSAKFIEDIITKLKSYGLDGVDLEWKNPACCIVPCTTKNQRAFLNFMKTFYEQTQKNKMLLALSIYPILDDYLFRNFAFPEQANYVDWIGLLMINAVTAAVKRTGHASPTATAFSTLNTFLKLKTDPKKLLFGYSAYSNSFTLKDKNKNKIGDAVTGVGHAGRFFKHPTLWAFFEICQEVKRKDWKIFRSPKIGNYAYRDNLWISYDDPASARYKVQVTKNLGGVVVWEIDLDDYANLCGCGHFPLLRVASFPDCEVPDCP